MFNKVITNEIFGAMTDSEKQCKPSVRLVAVRIAVKELHLCLGVLTTNFSR